MIEEEKRLFRKSALKKRAKITNRQEKSAQIARNLFDTEAYKNASMIFAYMSYRSEADTMPVIEHALAEQKCVAVPRVVLLDGEQGSGKMVFCRIMSLNDCVKGAYGILEPREDCPTVQPDETSLILVPGCAFTRGGLRMGYGGGYYDRYLQIYPKAVTVGYAFEEQLFDAIPSEAHDRRLDFVLTQKECYEAECSRRQTKLKTWSSIKT